MGSVRNVLVWILLVISFCFLTHGGDDCPKPCSCTKVKVGRKVSCSSRGIADLNIKIIPKDTVEIDFTANEIQIIKKDSFLIPRNNKVKKLILRSNKIHTIEPGAFRRFTRLSRLYLEENSLLKIESNALKGLKKLRHLNVSTNQLMYIETSAFIHTGSLKKLSLSNNKLVTLSHEPFVNVTVRSLQLDRNPLICDCGIKWMKDWIKKNGVSLSENSKCEYPEKLRGTKIMSLLEKDWDCRRVPLEIPQFHLSPSANQVSFEKDSLSFHCSVLWHPSAKLIWYKNGKPFSAHQNHTFVRDISDLRGRTNHSILIFSRLEQVHSGDYSCHIQLGGTGRVEQKVNVRVLSSNSKYCKLDITKTDRGAFVWHNTAAGGVAIVPCQFGGIRPHASAIRKCLDNGSWGKMNDKMCLHRNKVTRNLEVLNSYAVNQSNVVQSTRLLYTLSKNFTEHVINVQEIQFIVDILYSAAKFGYYSGSLRRYILKIINMLLAINVELLRKAQFERQLSSRLLDVIPLTARSTLNKKVDFNRIITDDIGAHVTTFQPHDYRGLSCILRFPRGPRRATIFERGEIFCSVGTKPAKLVEGLDAAVDFSPRLLSASAQDIPGLQRYSMNITFIAYRKSKLFIETVPLTALSKKENSALASVIIGLDVQVPGTPRTGMIESATIITFRNTKVGKNPRLVFWAKNDKKTGWVHMKSCALSGTNRKFTQFRCSRMPKNMLYLATLMDVEMPPVPIPFKPGIFVFIGSGICAAALILSILMYGTIRDLRYNRNDAAATMNLCLALLVADVVFVTGINQVQNEMLCKAFAVLLHYFLLCALLWLGCGGLCLQSLIVKVRSNDEYNPVLKYYLIGWGLPIIICGITLAGNSKNYITRDYCWLYPTASLAAFVGPGALLILINVGIYIRLHTAINRRYPESSVDGQGVVTEAKPKKIRGVSVTAASEIEDFKFPKKAEVLDLLRGSLALMLWFCGNVTFAIMMLAYRSKPSSVLHTLFSYGYALGTICIGLTVMFFYCLRQEAVRLVLKNIFRASTMKKAGELGTREDVLLLSNSPSQGNEAVLRPQEQLALMTCNVKEHSDIVSGISGPPSVFTDAVSSRPSSIMGPVVPFNFEQNAEKIKELAPVSERDVTENEGKSMHSHASSRNINTRSSDRDITHTGLKSVGGSSPGRTDEPVSAPLAFADYSSNTLTRSMAQSNQSEVLNTSYAALKTEQSRPDPGQNHLDHKYTDKSEHISEQPASNKPPGSLTGMSSVGGSVDLPSNLKAFVPPNWKPARRGGSGVSYYPYFDHNFHRLPKRIPSSQGISGQIASPRPVPIPSRGDAQGGPATTVSHAAHNQIPLLSSQSKQADTYMTRGQPVGQSIGSTSQMSPGLQGAISTSLEEKLSQHCNSSISEPGHRFIEPALVHTGRHTVHDDLKALPDVPEETATGKESCIPPASGYSQISPTLDKRTMIDNSNHGTIINHSNDGTIINHSNDGVMIEHSNDAAALQNNVCQPSETVDCSEVHPTSNDALSPTASSQQSDNKGSREGRSTSQSQISRRHRKRRRRKRPSSIPFDELPVTKTIIYIPIPHQEQPVKLREETSV